MTPHSKNFAKVKDFFIKGVWDEGRLNDAVKQDWITDTEYKEITGKKYINE